MASTPVRPAEERDRISTVSEELIFHSETTRVVRRCMESSAEYVVIKEAIGAPALARLRHERTMLKRVADVHGVPRLASGEWPEDVLVTRDEGGVSLKDRLQQGALPFEQALALGISLGRTLSGVHRAGVLHKDINPSNIIVAGPTLQPTLIDFNISSSSAEERPAFTHQTQIGGTLAYMAPEQTGRTGRSVDHRSDLYALGATLYEAATGRKPFDREDLLDLIRAQLVGMPLEPARCDPPVPQALSDVIMKLLEKEPDHRYQSADGLVFDLERIEEAGRLQTLSPIVLGQRDFPMRLSPPSRPVGRETEIAQLEAAVEQVASGGGVSLLVFGPPGVGKSTVINELRAMVTRHRGWFVSGKFDQYRHDGASATTQALKNLGRIMLAESPEMVASYRQRILRSVGVNAGLGPTLLPEFKLLLGELPVVDVSDPVEAEIRLVQCVVDLLRGIASPERPVVFVVDDLQWAPPVSLRFLDALLNESEPIGGLLFVGAYRDSEVDDAHPLRNMLSRWSELGCAPQNLRVDNLPPADMGTLVADMLRISPMEAASLSTAALPFTGGNPYDTVELLNALRQDGVLDTKNGAWTWDTTAIRQYVGGARVVDLLKRRFESLPTQSGALVETLACLGGSVRHKLLASASGLSDDELTRWLEPALEDGLLVVEPGNPPLLKFRHDRVQEAMLDHMGGARRADRHLALARRFAAEAGLASLCAEQYLPAAALVRDEEECRAVAQRFAQAATMQRLSNFDAVERYLSAAIRLLQRLENEPLDGQLLQMKIGRHAALYALGRLEKADGVYADIQAACGDPVRLAIAADVQINSLANRGRHAQAMALGLALLQRLGVPRPQDIRSALGEGMAWLSGWESRQAGQGDLTRPEVSDRKMLAAGALLVRTGMAAYFCDPATFAWTIIEAHRAWSQQGPCAALMPSVSAAPFLLVGAPQDYRGAHAIGKHFVAVGSARHFETGTALARCIFALSAAHWVEPAEATVAHFRAARESLIRAGDFQFASYTYLASDALLDCAPTLESAASEIESGLAFAKRSRNADYIVRSLPRRQLIRALRGETRTPGSFSDDAFDEDAHRASLPRESTAEAMYHVFRAMGAALFNDRESLDQHSAHAVLLLAKCPGYYITAAAHWMRALALANALRADRSDTVPDKILNELQAERAWLAARAEDAPANFAHLALFIDAECAWAAGEVWRAGERFDAAIAMTSGRARPWHQAFITERAGLFHLAQGMEASGQRLIAQARDLYETWGATGKVSHLVSEHSFLRNAAAARRLRTTHSSPIMSTDMVDTLAVLRASQALSSERSLASLTTKLTHLMGSLAGATRLDVLVRHEDGDTWFLAETVESADVRVSAEQAAAAGRIPLSAVRYVERTRQRLVLDDGPRDERFAKDPSWLGLDQCSLVVLPILHQGDLKALLVLQNRLQRAAFSADRLDAVELISGQLSVSLENARLYGTLERKVAERTAALEEANQRLALLSQTDSLTGLANRRHFDHTLALECQRARRTGAMTALIMIDIDQFKQYNDHYGHQGGDRCLRLVASILQACMRHGGDLLARFGGEEFVLLLPDTDVHGAHALAERLRTAIEEAREPHVTSTHGVVTISVGCSAFRSNQDEDSQTAMAAADEALYAAKRGGRNQVVMSPSLNCV